MTLAINKAEHDQARISQSAHMSEWGLNIKRDQLDYVIERLISVRDEIDANK